MKRRQFMKCAMGSLVVIQQPLIAKSANAIESKKKKIVWVMLRGALDSLSTIIPTSDTNLSKYRPTIAEAVLKDAKPLNENFALHASLSNLHQWYESKELIPIVSVGSGFSNRSHFDGQDYLESGYKEINQDSGWLARAAYLKEVNSIAVARSKPISLRGDENATSWYPSNLKDANESTYDALLGMYEETDPVLFERLQNGLNLKSMTMGETTKKSGRFKSLAQSCGKLLAGDNNIDCAMLELGGWDTHINQVSRLNRQLKTLDDGLFLLKKELGEQWKDTVVIVGTEFGRTARENGTKGTDHGTASLMLLAGGGLNGGVVKGHWPGLEEKNLFENRDLKATTNTFGWISTVLAQHWELSNKQINAVFPDLESRYDEKIIL